MARKPTDTVHFKLRIRESLRRQLEKAAATNRASINSEIATRLAASFDDQSTRTLDVIASDFGTIYAGLADVCQRLNVLLDAPEKLGKIAGLMDALKASGSEDEAAKTRPPVGQIVDLMEAIRAPISISRFNPERIEREEKELKKLREWMTGAKDGPPTAVRQPRTKKEPSK
jgi:hypothetical protein